MPAPSCHRPVAVAMASVLLAAAASCAGADSSSPPGTIRVFKSLGSVQCAAAGVDLRTLEKQLDDAKLKVLSSSCGSDGRMHAAMCGASDGRIAIFELSAKDAESAAKLGFNAIGALPEAKLLPCK